MAIKLFPNGEIEFYYGDDITSGLEWAGGISDGDGSFSMADISNSYTIPNGHTTKFVAPPFPAGMQIDTDGILQGTPIEANGTWNINFVVTDYSQVFSIKELTFSTVLTGVGLQTEDNENSIVCSPNPFSGHSLITFSIRNQDKVSLNVYGANGQLIKTLIDQELLQSGTHTYSWDGCNNSGIKTRSGIYYGVLTFSGKQETIKMIQMR
ncbi:MAG: FlgD immunoglobulin-like domain containing protein [Bacteroidales bacterium]